MRLTIKFNQS